MGERRGWEHRDGFRAEHFSSRRLWLIVPLPCTHRTGLSNRSSKWGHCLSAAQGEQLTLEKLDSALAYWVVGRKREMQPGLLYIWLYGTFIAVLVAVNISLLIQRGAVLLRTDNSCLCSSLAAVFILRGTPWTRTAQGPTGRRTRSELNHRAVG